MSARAVERLRTPVSASAPGRAQPTAAGGTIIECWDAVSASTPGRAQPTSAGFSVEVAVLNVRLPTAQVDEPRRRWGQQATRGRQNILKQTHAQTMPTFIFDQNIPFNIPRRVVLRRQPFQKPYFSKNPKRVVLRRQLCMYRTRARVRRQGIEGIVRLLRTVPIVGVNELAPVHQKTFDDGVRAKLPEAVCYSSQEGNALFWRRPQCGTGTGGGGQEGAGRRRRAGGQAMRTGSQTGRQVGGQAGRPCPARQAGARLAGPDATSPPRLPYSGPARMSARPPACLPCPALPCPARQAGGQAGRQAGPSNLQLVAKAQRPGGLRQRADSDARRQPPGRQDLRPCGVQQDRRCFDAQRALRRDAMPPRPVWQHHIRQVDLRRQPVAVQAGPQGS